MTHREKTWHYIHFGYWPGEAPKEPDDLRDCARDSERHRRERPSDCPFCKGPTQGDEGT